MHRQMAETPPLIFHQMAPSTLPRTTIEPLLHAALKMAQKLRYLGLGTFEFLVNSELQEWVFLEINPRIQVEHTVTGEQWRSTLIFISVFTLRSEEISNVDLVHVQLRLSVPGTTLADVLPEHVSSSAPPKGQAIQLRLVAEDPHRSFQLYPDTLRPSDISWPAGRGVRVDTWLSTGPYAHVSQAEWAVGVDFDSVLAKVIVHGASFDEATARAQRALREIRIAGDTKTNLQLLAGVLSHPDWRAGTIHTRWLEENVDQVLRLGANNLPSATSPALHIPSTNNAAGAPGTILLQPGSSFQLSLSPSSDTLLPHSQTQVHGLVLSTIRRNAFPDELSGTITSSLSSTPLTFSLTQSSSIATSSSFEFANPVDLSHLSCPLAGKIVELHPALAAAADGPSSQTFIREGEALVVVSAMKMESVVNAPRSGHVSRVGKGIEIGAVVPEGSLVCVLNFLEKDQLARL